VDLSLFKPISRDEARRKLGWDRDSRFVFFNLGGRPSGKRLSLAEQAVAHARRTIPDVELVPVSKVDPDRIPLFMNACDCLVLTSEWEGSPTVVKEALACNLPVVSVDVGDVKELIKGVRPSCIVAPEAEAIGDALVEILKMGTRSNGLTRAGDMSERTTTSRVLAIYEGIMADQQPFRTR
jgi:glycosyltransferase involved in cell wall biosynthesis